jgi:hypothetical protein
MLQRQKERERQEWRNNPNTRSSSAEMVRRIFFYEMVRRFAHQSPWSERVKRRERKKCSSRLPRL